LSFSVGIVPVTLIWFLERWNLLVDAVDKASHLVFPSVVKSFESLALKTYCLNTDCKVDERPVLITTVVTSKSSLTNLPWLIEQ